MATYQSNPYPDYVRKRLLANLVNTSQKHIHHWFSYTRKKERKVHSVKRMNEYQTQILKKCFQANPYPDFVTRVRLAQSMNVSEKKVNGWFIWFRVKQRSKGFLKTMTEAQQKILIASYQANRDLSDKEKTRLASLLQTSQAVIQHWFTKTRKEEKKKKMLFRCELTIIIH